MTSFCTENLLTFKKKECTCVGISTIYGMDIMKDYSAKNIYICKFTYVLGITGV